MSLISSICASQTHSSNKTQCKVCQNNFLCLSIFSLNLNTGDKRGTRKVFSTGFNLHIVFFSLPFPRRSISNFILFYIIIIFFSPETKGLGIWGILMCVKQTLLTKKERRTQSFQHNSLCSTTGC